MFWPKNRETPPTTFSLSYNKIASLAGMYPSWRTLNIFTYVFIILFSIISFLYAEKKFKFTFQVIPAWSPNDWNDWSFSGSQLKQKLGETCKLDQEENLATTRSLNSFGGCLLFPMNCVYVLLIELELIFNCDSNIFEMMYL